MSKNSDSSKNSGFNNQQSTPAPSRDSHPQTGHYGRDATYTTQSGRTDFTVGAGYNRDSRDVTWGGGVSHRPSRDIEIYGNVNSKGGGSVGIRVKF